jgi:hypothetical protein
VLSSNTGKVSKSGSIAMDRLCNMGETECVRTFLVGMFNGKRPLGTTEEHRSSKF